MPEHNIYYVGETKYDILDSKVEEFTKDFPLAIRANQYIVGKDTFDIRENEVESFVKDFPEAKLLPGSYILPKDFGAQFKEAWKETTERLKDVTISTFSEITPILPAYGQKPRLRGEDTKDALIHAFEPIFEALDPTLEEPLGKRLGKEAVLFPIMAITIPLMLADDPIKTVKGIGSFFLHTINDWIEALRSPLDPLYDSVKALKAREEIIRTPLFHTIPILGLGGLFRTKIGKLSPKAAEQLSTKLAKDVVKEIQKRPELIGKPFPDITKVSELRAKEALKKAEAERQITVPDVELVEKARQVTIPEEFKIKQLSDAKEVQEMFNRSRIESTEKFKPKLRNFLNRGVTAIIDVSGNIKRKLIKEGGAEGQKAVMEHDLIRGSSARASLLMEEYNSKIYKGLNKSDRQMLDDLIASRREIVIEEYKGDFKHMEGKTQEQFTNYIESFKSTNPKQYQKINALADEYFKVQKDQFEQLNNAGMLEKEVYELLKDKEYSPRKLLDYIDPQVSYTHEGGKINITSSGLNKLVGGSLKLIETDSRLLLAQVVSRTQTRIARNRANQTLYEMALKYPENGIVEIMKGDKVPAGKDMISVMIDGKRKDMLLPRKMAKEWVETSPLISQQMANLLSWGSGSKILRPMATGINPEFAIANFPRDALHIYLVGQDVVGKGIYSPHLPIFGGQMALDLKTTFKDAFTRKGRYKDYIMEGGGMEFLTHQGGGGIGRVGAIGKTKGAFSRVGEYLGYLGETSELWTRLALRERALKKGYSKTEATWIARNYLDFAQGGNVAKAFDTAIPYLNAGIQGTRGVFRSVRQNPGEFMIKTAWIGSTAASLWLANRYTNPEAWEAIPDYAKAQNWIITTPFGYTDAKNNKRYIYFTVAKDQGQRVIATGFEMMMSRAFDGEFSEDQLNIAAKDFIPYEPTTSLPPMYTAIAGYKHNLDFYRNTEIWRGYDKIDPSEEYYLGERGTHPFWKVLSKSGEKVLGFEDDSIKGISPERIKYATAQFLTRKNIYTDLVGGGYKLITEGLPEKDKEKAKAEVLKNIPFVRKGFKVTPSYIKEKGIEETKITEDTEAFKRRRTLDVMIEKHIDGKVTKDEVLKHIRSYKDPNIRKSLLNRFKGSMSISKLSNLAWWQQLSRLSPESRAEEFYKKHKLLDAKKKKQLERESLLKPGFASERFRKKLNQLYKEGK